MANERKYADVAATDTLSGSLSLRYFLIDDYYGAVPPLPYKGRELYLPQVAVGRLVESPSEMAAVIDAFFDQPVLTPGDALVTGYDFLIDQATIITDTLASQGITAQTHLIDNSWTAQVFSDTLFTLATAPSLMSLNSHFEHYRFFPNDPNDIFAAQVTVTTNYDGALVFSVGCHSGLNVADAQSMSSLTAVDWPQAFGRQRASFIGNTGYGYGIRNWWHIRSCSWLNL